jgi:hypothetical protein
MSYAANTYGSSEYAGGVSGAVLVPEPESPASPVAAENRTVLLRLQPNPVVSYENRSVIAMPSATSDPVTFIKDPGSVKDYGFDWSEILETGETIASAVWNGGGLTSSGAYISGENTYTLLAGGTLGTTYIVSCTITTSLGRTYCREFLISVEAT